MRKTALLLLLLSILPAIAVSCIKAPPSNISFVTQPKPAVVVEGEGCMFQIVTSPRDALVQWCKDGQPILGATGSVYAIQETLEGFAGVYTALARLPGSSTYVRSEPAELTYVPLLTVLADGNRVTGSLVETKRPVTVSFAPNIRGFRQVTYTVDGTEPTAASTPYTGPFTIHRVGWLRIWVDGQESVESVRFGFPEAFVPPGDRD